MLFSKTKKNVQSLGKVLGLMIIMASSHNSFAQEKGGKFFGQQAAGKWIIGAKAASIDVNVSSISDSTGLGIVLGYEFAKPIGKGKSSFELEYISGDEENLNIDSLGSYEVSVLNAFFTYRSPGDFYYKVKGGLSYADIDVRFGSLLDNDFEDVAIAGGIGIGYRINDAGMIELEYSKDAGDADLGVLSLNGLFKF